MLAKYCHVEITRNSAGGVVDKIPKQVYEHEIPILNIIFGKGLVNKIKVPRQVYNTRKKVIEERGEQKYPIVEIDHDREYLRLQNVYGQNEQQPRMNVEIVYGFEEEAVMERKGEDLYRPLINAGHTFIPFAEEDEEEFDYSDPTVDFDDISKAPEQSEVGQVQVEAAAQDDEVAGDDGDVLKVFDPSAMDKPELMALMDQQGIPHDKRLGLKMLLEVYEEHAMGAAVGVDPEVVE